MSRFTFILVAALVIAALRPDWPAMASGQTTYVTSGNFTLGAWMSNQNSIYTLSQSGLVDIAAQNAHGNVVGDGALPGETDDFYIYATTLLYDSNSTLLAYNITPQQDYGWIYNYSSVDTVSDGRDAACTLSYQLQNHGNYTIHWNAFTVRDSTSDSASDQTIGNLTW